jgi:hypothetical protein
MRSLLVAYDLVGTDDTSENYEKLIARIKEYPNWARVELSTWVLKTDAKAEEVRDDLLGFMHSSDRLFVAVLTGEAAWHKVLCENKWLKDNL